MATLQHQVGSMVRHYRKAAGLTQAQLAGLTDKSEEMINRVERGVAAPSFATLERLSAALRTPVRNFFGVGGYEAEGGKDDGLVRLMERVSNLDAPDIDWIDQLVAVALRRKVRAVATVD